MEKHFGSLPTVQPPVLLHRSSPLRSLASASFLSFPCTVIPADVWFRIFFIAAPSS